jgi:hypothetical protein
LPRKLDAARTGHRFSDCRTPRLADSLPVAAKDAAPKVGEKLAPPGIVATFVARRKALQSARLDCVRCIAQCRQQGLSESVQDVVHGSVATNLIA